LTAEDLMSSPAITVHPEATIVEAARLLDAHRIKRMPVTDDQNRLVGIVSRRDLLSVFTRTDEEIRDEVRHEVFALADPTQVSVYVRHGVVTLGGTMRQKDLIPIVVRLAAATDGVVGVIDGLSPDKAGAEP
jgi:CBS-domain-containing membrane protein